MKNYIFILLMMVGVFCYSQNENNSNMSNKNYELLKELNKNEKSRVDRVNSFLRNNPNIKETYKDSINISHIYDIVDGKPIYRSTTNLQAGRATNTNHLHPGGSLNLNLEGEGMTIGVWDSGPAENTHPEFFEGENSRIVLMDNSTVDGSLGFDNHGTHVTGTIAASGANSEALGMAPKAIVKSYNWTNDNAEMVLAANDPENPILISNHSYGIPINNVDPWFMGAYTSDARQIDAIARQNQKYLIVTSAGNSGNSTYSGGLFNGFDKLTGDKNSKNNLVIANANPLVEEVPIFSGNFEVTSLLINDGSSQGPSDDLRIKPDIAGDGTNLFSSITNESYTSYTGTSMSSPNVAGTLLLLQQYYNQLNGDYMNSSTIKALVCHTAIDDNNTIGPDPEFGWGFLDAKASAELILDSTNENAIIRELTLDQDETYTTTFTVDEGQKVKATLCWTDMPGFVVENGASNDQTPRLINDLDIRLTKDGNTFFPWRLEYDASSGFSNSKGDNIRDNVEKIEIDFPSAGLYTLTVSHKGTLSGDEGGPFDPQSQDFSLVVTGDNITLSNEVFEEEIGLSIWPNPAKEKINITFNKLNSNEVNVEIYDITGRKVLMKKLNSSLNNHPIDVSNFNKGTYLISLKTNQGEITKKFIKK